MDGTGKGLTQNRAETSGFHAYSNKKDHSNMVLFLCVIFFLCLFVFSVFVCLFLIFRGAVSNMPTGHFSSHSSNLRAGAPCPPCRTSCTPEARAGRRRTSGRVRGRAGAYRASRPKYHIAGEAPRASLATPKPMSRARTNPGLGRGVSKPPSAADKIIQPCQEQPYHSLVEEQLHPGSQHVV